jgi:hypothetical protein
MHPLGLKETAKRIIKEIQRNGFNPSELDYNLAAFAYLKVWLFSFTYALLAVLRFTCRG